MCVFDRGQTICEGTVFSYPNILGYVRNIIFTKSSTNDALVERYLVTSTRVMSMFFLLFVFLAIFPRPPSSPNLRGRWQLGYN